MEKKKCNVKSDDLLNKVRDQPAGEHSIGLGLEVDDDDDIDNETLIVRAEMQQNDNEDEELSGQIISDNAGGIKKREIDTSVNSEANVNNRSDTGNRDESSLSPEQTLVPSNDDEQGDTTEIESLLAEGTEFDSFESFKVAKERYSELTGVYFSKNDSLSVDRAHAITKHKLYNPAIQYTHISYVCVYGGKKQQSKSSGLRNASSRKCDCPVRLRLSVTADGQGLVVKESKLDCHNHSLEEDKRRLRNLDEETEMEIYSLICLHENKRLARMMVRDKLTKETGKEIKMKDICNIEKRMAKKVERLNGIETTEMETSNLSDAGNLSNDGGERDSDGNDGGTEEDSPEKRTENISKSSSRRPRRSVKEPGRFKGFQKAVSKKKSATPASNETPGGDKMHKGVGRPRVKKEPALPTTMIPGPGRKRKASSSTDETPIKTSRKTAQNGEDRKRQPSEDEGSQSSQANNDLKRRKLKVQEELLELEKKKMKMMEEMIGKLDRILENQDAEKRKTEET